MFFSPRDLVQSKVFNIQGHILSKSLSEKYWMDIPTENAICVFVIIFLSVGVVCPFLPDLIATSTLSCTLYFLHSPLGVQSGSSCNETSTERGRGNFVVSH